MRLEIDLKKTFFFDKNPNSITQKMVLAMKLGLELLELDRRVEDERAQDAVTSIFV